MTHDMYFVKDDQTSIEAIKYDIKQGAITCIFMKFWERTWIVYITPNVLPQDMGVR